MRVVDKFRKPSFLAELATLGFLLPEKIIVCVLIQGIVFTTDLQEL